MLARPRQRRSKKRKSGVREAQDSSDEAEDLEDFSEMEMSTDLEPPCTHYRPPDEMVISAKNGKAWVNDGLLKSTELIHFFAILGLCRNRLIRQAIAAHVAELDRDEFVAFAKTVLALTHGRASKMALNKLKIKTRSDPQFAPASLENKLRGRDRSSVFRERQADGTMESVTTQRPMYTTCVRLELQCFLNDFTPGDNEDYDLLTSAFDHGLYVQLCNEW